MCPAASSKRSFQSWPHCMHRAVAGCTSTSGSWAARRLGRGCMGASGEGWGGAYARSARTAGRLCAWPLCGGGGGAEAPRHCGGHSWVVKQPVEPLCWGTCHQWSPVRWACACWCKGTHRSLCHHRCQGRHQRHRPWAPSAPMDPALAGARVAKAWMGAIPQVNPAARQGALSRRKNVHP